MANEHVKTNAGEYLTIVLYGLIFMMNEYNIKKVQLYYMD